MNSDRHVIVISEDAMVYEDLEELRAMPAFGKILPDAALVERVRTVYPTVTYPVHAASAREHTAAATVSSITNGRT